MSLAFPSSIRQLKPLPCAVIFFQFENSHLVIKNILMVTCSRT